MTRQEIIESIENTFEEKIKKDENFIRYSYYEVNVKYTKTKEDKKLFMELLINKLENKNYKVYREGQRFNYNNANILVQTNEELIAIKNIKDNSSIQQKFKRNKWNKNSKK